jgi:sirohydrochlorin cobaltochelatase
LQDTRPYLSVEFAFQAVARPKVPAGLRRCAQLGAKQLVVAPFILFTGKVDEYILQVTRQAETELGLPALPASYLGVHDLVIDVAEQRINELLADSVMMSCDLCKYRFPMAGYAHEVGAPQETHHLHGGSAHSHEHHHGHHHHHDDDHGHPHHHDGEHGHHHHDDHEHEHEHGHHHDDDHDDCCHHHHHYRSPRRQFGRQGHHH